MKLMKLLLIGLLSVVAFIACDDTTDEPAAPAKVNIVGIDGKAPVLFDNVSVQLKAVDTAGDAIASPKVVTWGETDANTGFTVSTTGVVKVDLTAVIAGSVTLSVKTPKDSAVEGSVDTYDNVTYAPVVSALVLQSIVVTPAGEATIAVGETAQLTAKATFGTDKAAKEVVVTTDVTWASTADAKVSVTAAGLIKGEAVEATATNITAKLVSNGTDKTSTAKAVIVEAAPELGSFTIVVKNPTALNKGGVTVEFTITPTMTTGTATAAMSNPASYTCTFTAANAGIEPAAVGDTTCDKIKTIATSVTEKTTDVTAKFTAKNTVTDTVEVIRLAD